MGLSQAAKKTLKATTSEIEKNEEELREQKNAHQTMRRQNDQATVFRLAICLPLHATSIAMHLRLFPVILLSTSFSWIVYE